MEYIVTGKWTIDELFSARSLEKCIKAAYEYALSWSHKNPKAPVMMRVHTELEPIEYSFGFYVDILKEPADPEVFEPDGYNWHEVCRIKPIQ
jgi:hypothetical protein